MVDEAEESKEKQQEFMEDRQLSLAEGPVMLQKGIHFQVTTEGTFDTLYVLQMCGSLHAHSMYANACKQMLFAMQAMCSCM